MSKNELNLNWRENRAIVVAGPTASGKSKLALDLALALNGVIVNADSMQVYQGMPILSAVPTADEKARVEHCLYEVFLPEKNGTVVEWLRLAVAEVERIQGEGKLPIITGGTGLYIDNLINGTTPIPETSLEIRQKALEVLGQVGVQAMHKMVAEFDALSAERLSPNDTTRVRRAWEVFQQTGISLTQWHQKPMLKKLPQTQFATLKILPTKAELDERCDYRFERMIEQGAVEEVRHLAGLRLDRNLPAMKMLGVPELLGYVEGECALKEAIEQGKIHTRQYAKRQRTWFAHKLSGDVTLEACYQGEESELKNMINNVKKAL